MTAIACVPTVLVSTELRAGEIATFVGRLHSLLDTAGGPNHVFATVRSSVAGVTVRLECTHGGTTTTMQCTGDTFTTAATACLGQLRRQLDG
jgi:hypothetical protein